MGNIELEKDQVTREMLAVFSPSALAGRTALVTGGSRGIGRSVVLGLYALGAKVHFTYRSSAGEAAELCALLNNDGPRCSGHLVDYTRHENAKESLEKLAGEISPDILINNVGFSAPASFLATDADDFVLSFNANFMSAALTAQVFAPLMVRQNRGRIVNISSIAADRGERGMAAYSAMKAAIAGFTRTLAIELGGRGVTVNCISPGLVETDMLAKNMPSEVKEELCLRTPLGRVGRPSEIAQLAAFLCSEAAGFITGQTIIIDGGISVSLGTFPNLRKRGPRNGQ